MRKLLTASVLTLLLTADAIAGPADALLGSWGGSGRVYYTDGKAENISCSGSYTGGGNDLKLAIQCKADSNPIHIRSKLRLDGSSVSGDWEERTFNAAGAASGKVTSSSIFVTLSGGITGSMSVSYSKSHQDISIKTQGIGMSRATISMNRR